MTHPTHKAFLTPAADVLARLYRAIFRLFGRQTDEQTEPTKIQADLCLALAARPALPETVLQAFAAEPLAAGDARFIARHEQLDRGLAALELWRAGRGSMIAVTGPQGCGITSFLQQLAARAGEHETCRYGKLTRRPYDISDTMVLLNAAIGCEQPRGSVEELVEYLNGLTPSVFAIDNGHFLACRIMGANEAIRVFGAVMVATQQKHLWLLGCQEYAWRRLSYVYQAERYFSDRIELAFFSEPELGECLATRLRGSGIGLDVASGGEQEPIPAVLARHLSALHKLSNGKPDLAFFYFLNSLLVHAETKQLDMRAAVTLDFSALKQLTSEELFTLAEVAAHGQLTLTEHRAVFRVSAQESRLLLERLYHQCLLDKDPNAAEPTYRLVTVYSDVVTRYLNNANFLY